MNTTEKLNELAPLLFTKITECQNIVAEWILPDSKMTDSECLNLLLGHLDNGELVKRMREVEIKKLEEIFYPESPNIARITYEENSNTLELEFKENGNVYQYFDVPKGTWEQIKSEPSIGAAIARNLKGHFRYCRV